MRYRRRLPQLHGKTCLTDGGLETVMVFEEGLALPGFAAFVLLDQPEGEERLRRYFRRYSEIAKAQRLGLSLLSPTWRANPDWGRKLGYDRTRLEALNRRAITLLAEFREEEESEESPMPISGIIGPRGDGYAPAKAMTPEDAGDYHAWQINVFADTAVDLIAAMTLAYSAEASGAIAAARRAEMPVTVGFTVETDGKLPSGELLGEAIERCDRENDAYAAYFMVNCAHPTHFRETLAEGGTWVRRIGGVQVNASAQSHAELDNAAALDRGNPAELASETARLQMLAPGMTVLGGCCGTDHEHIQAIAAALRP